ncbi:MAG: xanthine dehydrogenase accessory protein XdhC [Betaproteobacteria bacterium]|nr:MAG: xanthine dehydrogenase accessory protein XdhC [Betaproteobacteria bacterium]
MTSLDLLDALAAAIADSRAVVWITVIGARGSTPREVGASMLTDAQASIGSVGGGQLELCAIARARSLLRHGTAGVAPPRQVERFPLGARLGQCCGGETTLAFDLVLPSQAGWVADARAALQAGTDWRALLAAHLPACAFPVQPRLPVALFGAGHVGRALAALLARLPVALTWIDSRDEAFPSEPGGEVRCIVSDAPESEVRSLPSACAAIVMTHSHALDLEIVHAWLRRGDFRFLGLIGSRSKRLRFEHQLRMRGHDDAALARLTCPVGIEGIRGKEPEVIAIAIAAQLLRLHPEPDRRQP